MKAIRNLLIGIILGVAIGWFLGFLHLPYIEKNFSFLMGFIACVVCMLVLLAMLFVSGKHSLLLQLIGGKPVPQGSKIAIRTYSVIWIFIAAFIVAGGLLSSFLIQRQSKFFKTQLQKQNNKIQELSELSESARKGNMVFLMNDILDKVDDELVDNPGRKLSDKTIARIVSAFNYSLAPYRNWEGDSLSGIKLSPEKGQLLLALTAKNIDSGSFNKIKHEALFYGADLSGADLRGIDLSGSDLRGADLKDSNLRGVNLNGVDLRDANLWGANLDSAILKGADLRRSKLGWAKLNEVDMDSTNFNGADLTNAQLRKANGPKATFRAAKLDGALLIEANLEGSNLSDASLIKSNLAKVNLTKSDLFMANLNEAILTEIQLDSTVVEKDWLGKLDGYHIKEAKEIRATYKVVLYLAIADLRKYRLEKI